MSRNKMMGKPLMLCRKFRVTRVRDRGGGEWNLGYLGPILQSMAHVGIWHHCGLHHFRMFVC